MPLEPDTVNLDTKYGSVHGVPTPVLGWCATAIIATYLVFNLANTVSTKLDRMIESQTRATLAMERIVDRIEKTFRQPTN